jgi:hypothetical protein
MKMIIVEREQEFVMITQYEHSLLSGKVAESWKQAYFKGIHRRDDAIYAISEHDDCWIDLDETPFWDDLHQVPYSFYNFPLVPKLTFYRHGLAQMEQINPYATLLCSLHFASFYQGTSDPNGKQYYREEEKRQERLKNSLQLHSQKATAELAFHFQLLQFCDDLSLYVCLNEPGVSKEDEFLWYRDGFSQNFAFAKGQGLMAHWLDHETVSVSPFPLEHAITHSLPLKKVSKSKIKQMGIAEAFKDTSLSQRVIRIQS